MSGVKFKITLSNILDYYFDENVDVLLSGKDKSKLKKISLKGKKGSSIEKALEEYGGNIAEWTGGIIYNAVEDYAFGNDFDLDDSLKPFVKENGGKYIPAGNINSVTLENEDGEWFVRDVDLDFSKMEMTRAGDFGQNAKEDTERIRKELGNYKLTEKDIKMFLRGLTLEQFAAATYEELQNHTNRKYVVGDGESYRSKSGKKKNKDAAGIKDRRISYITGGLKKKPVMAQDVDKALITVSPADWLMEVIKRVAGGKEKRKITDERKREAAAKLEADLAAKRKAAVQEINRQSDLLMKTFQKLRGAGFSPFNPGVMNIRTAKKPLNIPSLSEESVRKALGADTLIVWTPETREKAEKRTATVTYSGAGKSGGQGIRFYRFAPVVVSACQTIKGKFDLMYGCVMMAAYFQILVSNTPVDEDYVFLQERLSTYTRKTDRGLTKTDRKTGTVEPKKQTQLSTYITRRKHTADKVSVRGDWILTFRGKTFKAYDSEPEQGSLDVSADVYFGEEFFDRGVDTESIMRIAEMIMDATGRDFDSKRLVELEAEKLDPSLCVTNVNPRWQILETGGYTRNPSTKSPRKGSKYGLEHGTKAGFTYQAPKGFVRLTNALWSSLAETGKWADIAVSFIEGRQDEARSLISLDAKDTSSPLVRKLMRRDRNIGRAGFSSREIKGE